MISGIMIGTINKSVSKSRKVSKISLANNHKVGRHAGRLENSNFHLEIIII